jgi:uncharacterized protein YabN with tetrapyrrole methylase and pyrophosphatase domain
MKKTPPQKGSLTIIGTGIKLGGHMTQESMSVVKSADRVLAVVAEPATFEWLKRLNPNIKSLAVHYDKNKYRHQTYQLMVDEIVESVENGHKTAAVFYGHPGVFVNPSHKAIKRLKDLGYEAKMLPGISADACLFAELSVDPSRNGYQAYEATDFLLFNRTLDSSVSCVIWQIGVVGKMSIEKVEQADDNLKVLVDELLKYYPKSHEVILYLSSQFNIIESTIKRLPLSELPVSTIPELSTLFIPPAKPKQLNLTMAKKLNIDISKITT